ncbi:MAG TPA: hypothetical protein VHI99_19120 [Vicinamibacterales bacterium]|nr:hypothetical protein [Vicinamibacterales bacterium]
MPPVVPLNATSTAGGAASRNGRFEAVLADTRGVLRDVFARASRRGSLEVPAPVIASADQTRAVRDYLMRWITHPNPAGTFAARTRWLRWLPTPWVLRTLFALGYDGLIYLKDDRVIGHVFFQRRGAAVHGFSTAVSAPFDGYGYSVVIMLDYVAYASQLPGVERARVGRGQNNVTQRFLQRLKKYERHLAWHVAPDGWVTFRQNREADACGIATPRQFREQE